ncbi:hypothetical protein [Salibacterium sp. K-3]
MKQNPKLTKMLVKRLMKKHGLDRSLTELSDEEKSELREVIQELQDRVDQLMSSEQINEETVEKEKK